MARIKEDWLACLKLFPPWRPSCIMSDWLQSQSQINITRTAGAANAVMSSLHMHMRLATALGRVVCITTTSVIISTLNLIGAGHGALCHRSGSGEPLRHAPAAKRLQLLGQRGRRRR